MTSQYIIAKKRKKKVNISEIMNLKMHINVVLENYYGISEKQSEPREYIGREIGNFLIKKDWGLYNKIKIPPKLHFSIWDNFNVDLILLKRFETF
jgi:hypothetical protein